MQIGASTIKVNSCKSLIPISPDGLVYLARLQHRDEGKTKNPKSVDERIASDIVMMMIPGF